MSERDAPVILEHEGLERRPARHELKRDCLRSPDRCFLTAGEQPIAVMAGSARVGKRSQPTDCRAAPWGSVLGA